MFDINCLMLYSKFLEPRYYMVPCVVLQMQALLNGNLGMSGTTPSVQNAPNVQKVLPMDPVNMLASKDLVPLPYLTGITKHEGTFPLKSKPSSDTNLTLPYNKIRCLLEPP